LENKTEIIIYILTGMLLMVCLALGILLVFITHRKNMLQKEAEISHIAQEKTVAVFRASNEAEERERQKIAKELHDGIVTALSSIERNLDKCLKDYENKCFDPERLKKEISYLEQTNETVRAISHDLIPPSLLAFGLIKTLEDFVARINDVEGKKSGFENLTQYEENLPIAMQDQLNIFRMCNEIINNLDKYADYNYLKVTIENPQNELFIDFIHDGKGITNKEIESAENSGNGLGLKSLKSRAIILNATINYTVEEDTSIVSIKIPMK
jgi:two-component system NarL family sensor kinase